MKRLAILAALALTACSPNGCSQETPPVEKTGGLSPAPTPDPAPTPPAAPTQVTWPHEPPGALLPASGVGIADSTVWSPGMRFPIEVAPAYANSQTNAYGGMFSTDNTRDECDPDNYAYPWRDNFCEDRNRINGMCPGDGKGHQGQDIRPSTCANSVHWAVAAEAGYVTSIGSYSVYIRGDSGRMYTYLHMNRAHVNTILTEGQRVTRGQRVGKISNAPGGTSIHLHFEIQAPVASNGSSAVVFVSPYASLTESYQRLLQSGVGEEPPSA